MDALGDEEAEVEGRSGDLLGGTLGAVRPQLAVGGGEFDAEGFGGRRDPPYEEGVVAGPVADPGDVPQPGGRRAYGPEGVGDVLAVRPGLHQPGGGHGGGAHRRPVPGEPDPGRDRAQGLLELLAAGPPAGEEFGGRQLRALLRALVDEAVGGGEGLLGLGGEGVGVGGGEEGGPVGPGEVGDLMGDRPAGRGGRRGPPILAQLSDETVEFFTLVTQVVEDDDGVGHGALPSGDGRSRAFAEEHASGTRNNQACLL